MNYYLIPGENPDDNHTTALFVGHDCPLWKTELEGWATPNLTIHDPNRSMRVHCVEVADAVPETTAPIVVTTAELKMLMMPEYEKIIAARESNPTVYALFDILLDPSLKPFPLNSKFLVDSMHRLVEQEFISSDRVKMILAGVMQ